MRGDEEERERKEGDVDNRRQKKRQERKGKKRKRGQADEGVDDRGKVKEAEFVLTWGVQVNRQAVFGDHLQVLMFW